MTHRPNAFQKLIHRLLMLKPISALLARILHHVDLLVLSQSNKHHTLTEIVGLPVLQLMTIGAKTGKQHTTPLVGLQEGARIAIVASNFGRTHNPGWYHNLKANPECRVVCNGSSGAFTAREVEGEEFEKYWHLALLYYAGYEKYRVRAAPRRIPVMVLESRKELP